MKNLRITVIALFFGAAFAVSSCGPSLCDCVNADGKDKDLLEKCAEKYKMDEDASKEEMEEMQKKVEECLKEAEGEEEEKEGEE